MSCTCPLDGRKLAIQRYDPSISPPLTSDTLLIQLQHWLSSTYTFTPLCEAAVAGRMTLEKFATYVEERYGIPKGNVEMHKCWVSEQRACRLSMYVITCDAGVDVS